MNLKDGLRAARHGENQLGAALDGATRLGGPRGRLGGFGEARQGQASESAGQSIPSGNTYYHFLIG